MRLSPTGIVARSCLRKKVGKPVEVRVTRSDFLPARLDGGSSICLKVLAVGDGFFVGDPLGGAAVELSCDSVREIRDGWGVAL